MTYQQKLREDMEAATCRFRGLVEANKVMVFSTTSCDDCTVAKRILGELGTRYRCLEVNKLGRDGALLMNVVKAVTGHRSVPAVFICGRAVPGGESGLERLHSAGQLAGLLERCCRGDVTCSEGSPLRDR